MRRSVLFLLALVAMLAGSAPGASADDPRSAGGMLAWPHEEMVRALGIFVPDQMKIYDVPGVSIAIVKDGAIVYSATFGKAELGSDAPVTPATQFEAGEIGETVAAYAALELVRDKLLFLDAPLSRDLAKPWLDNAEDNRLVTLREVLTHTSGLADNVAHPSHSTHFAPGSRFSHSGVGFIYLQHVMEEVAEEPFETLTAKRIFAPFGMTASGYAPVANEGDLARGYVPLSYPVLLFYLPFIASFLLALAVVWGIVRFGLQRGLEPADLLWPLTAGLVFAVAIVWYGLGFRHGAFVIGTAVAFALAVGFAGGLIYYLFYVVGIVSSRDGVIARGRDPMERTGFAYALALAFAISLLCFDLSLGVPRFSLLRLETTPNAARSFHTNAADLGRFMIGFLNAEGLGPAMRARMLGDRVELAPPFAWGLGIGIRQGSAEGAAEGRPGGDLNETLWARGSRMGFESLMVMDPARRAGVVVLTNSRDGGALAQDVARNVLGLEGTWSLP